MTLSKRRVLLIAVASVAIACPIAIGLVRVGVLDGHKVTTTVPVSAHDNAARVTEPSDRFIIFYAENSTTGEVIISVKTYGENVLNFLPVEDKEALTTVAGKFSVKLENVTIHAMSTAAVKLSDEFTVDQVKEFISTFETTDGIEAAKPDLHVTALGNTSTQDSNVPNDPYLSGQWDTTSGSYRINTTNAWPQFTDKGATVAVIDNGVLTDHPGLEGQLLPSYDLISDAERARDNDGYDAGPYNKGDWDEPGKYSAPNGVDRSRPPSWHDSHVTGTITTCTNNDDDVAGAAPNAKIVPVRALGRCDGESTNIVDAITWVSDGRANDAPANKSLAQVLSLSVGGVRVCPRFYQKVINVTVERGSIVMAVANNFNEDARNAAPVNCENAIAVGAVTSTETRPSFSNYGDTVEISAPGGDSNKNNLKILSTTDGPQTTFRSVGYSNIADISQAAPHVPDTIVLMLTTNPDLRTAEIVTILQNAAIPLSRYNRKSCDTGIVSTTSAIAEASNRSTKPGSKPSAEPSATSGGRALRLGS